MSEKSETIMPEIKDAGGLTISVNDKVKFFHMFENGMQEIERKVLSTGHNVDTKNNLIHTLIKTNLGWRTAYDTRKIIQP